MSLETKSKMIHLLIERVDLETLTLFLDIISDEYKEGIEFGIKICKDVYDTSEQTNCISNEIISHKYLGNRLR